MRKEGEEVREGMEEHREGQSEEVGGGQGASLCARLPRCSETRRMAEAPAQKGGLSSPQAPSLMQ